MLSTVSGSSPLMAVASSTRQRTTMGLGDVANKQGCDSGGGELAEEEQDGKRKRSGGREEWWQRTRSSRRSIMRCSKSGERNG